MDQIRKDPITIVLKHGCSIAQRDQEGVAASFGSIKLGDIIISLITIGYADYLHTYYNVPKNAILPLNIQYRTVSVISTPLSAFLSFFINLSSCQPLFIVVFSKGKGHEHLVILCLRVFHFHLDAPLAKSCLFLIHLLE